MTAMTRTASAGGRRVALAAGLIALALAFLAALRPASAATEITRVVSPGGIEAWLVQDSSVPLIAMSFAFDGAGSAQDPDGKEGLANMLTGLLDEGAGDMDSAAFQARLDELSIEVSFDSGQDSFYGTLRTLTADREEAFRLLALAVNQPRFDAEPVARIRAQIVAGIRAGERDPDEIAAETWARTAFAGHPYARSSEGTLDTVAAITADDLRAFHRRAFGRDILKIAVVGAIDPQTLGRELDRAFGSLPAKAELRPIPEAAFAGDGRIDVEMDIPQSVLRFGGGGVKRDDPDFIPAYIADYILGGGSFSSRLYEEVREKRGLAYTVFTTMMTLDRAGIEFGGTATRADRAEEALAIIQAEIDRFIAEGPTAEEVERAKSYLIGSYALRFTSSTRIARQLLGIQMQNLGIDYINRRNDLVAAVTVEEVRAAAKRLFSGGLLVVRVGPGAS